MKYSHDKPSYQSILHLIKHPKFIKISNEFVA